MGSRQLGLILAMLAAVCVLAAHEVPLNAEPKAATEAETASQVYNLLKDKCYSCHGEGGKRVMGRKGTLNYILDYDKLVSAGLINTAAPEKSPLYREISEGNMPRERDSSGIVRDGKPLSQAEMDLVLSWIKAGAPEWESPAPESQAYIWTQIKDEKFATGLKNRTSAALSAAPGATVLLYGGAQSHLLDKETWVLKGAVWAKSRPKKTPSAGHKVLTAYDSQRDVTVAFGGDLSASLFSDPGSSYETWEWNGSAWNKIETKSSPKISRHAAMAFDAARGKVVLFGSSTGLYKEGKPETWEYDGANWTRVETKSAPASFIGPAMAYDEVGKTVLLFGGVNPEDIAYSETWRFDGVTWTKLDCSVAPSPRRDAVMASGGGRILLVSGRPAGIDGSRYPIADCWIWDGAGWSKLAQAPDVSSSRSFAWDAAGKRFLYAAAHPTSDDNGLLWWECVEKK